MDWMLMPLRRYTDFEGRSRRMEYWMFQLLNALVSLVFVFLMMMGGIGIETLANGDVGSSPEVGIMFYIGAGLLVLWALFVFIPSIAVTVRRLHDRDMSGWWYLGIIVASLIPVVGFVASIAFLVLMFLPGTDGPNRFGPDPKGEGDATVFE